MLSLVNKHCGNNGEVSDQVVAVGVRKRFFNQNYLIKYLGIFKCHNLTLCGLILNA